jgi:hypothetical protein
MADARERVRVCSKVVVTGVAFFDFFHGQNGRGAERDRDPSGSGVSLLVPAS